MCSLHLCHGKLRETLQVTFDIDLKVNVFEANIRLLGGLLSAHLLASDPQLGLMQKPYKQQLLTQATDLGNRLLHAFDASLTGMPYVHTISWAALDVSIWVAYFLIIAYHATFGFGLQQFQLHTALWDVSAVGT